MPGMNQAVSNGTGRPEAIFTHEQLDIIKRAALSGPEVAPLRATTGIAPVGSGGSVNESEYNITIDMRGATIDDGSIDNLEKRVVAILDARDSRRGRTRRIG